MSWHYLQGEEEEYWEGSCLDGAPSALLKLMPIAGESCLAGRGTESSSHVRSGTTCGHLTANRGAEVSTLSAEDFRARTLAARERELESMASGAGSGVSLPGSLARWDRGTCSWRTSQR